MTFHQSVIRMLLVSSIAIVNSTYATPTEDIDVEIGALNGTTTPPCDTVKIWGYQDQHCKTGPLPPLTADITPLGRSVQALEWQYSDGLPVGIQSFKYAGQRLPNSTCNPIQFRFYNEQGLLVGVYNADENLQGATAVYLTPGQRDAGCVATTSNITTYEGVEMLVAISDDLMAVGRDGGSSIVSDPMEGFLHFVRWIGKRWMRVEPRTRWPARED